jgi:hypothetical protein
MKTTRLGNLRQRVVVDTRGVSDVVARSCDDWHRAVCMGGFTMRPVNDPLEFSPLEIIARPFYTSWRLSIGESQWYIA